MAETIQGVGHGGKLTRSPMIGNRLHRCGDRLSDRESERAMCEVSAT